MRVRASQVRNLGRIGAKAGWRCCAAAANLSVFKTGPSRHIFRTHCRTAQIRPQNQGEVHVDWYATVFEIIDMRSFSNLWYWIALAVSWSTVSHWVVGVPFDLIQKAARLEGEAQHDLVDLVRINCNRLLYVAGVSGLWILGFAAALFTSLAILGFWYWVEFAQAVFLLLFPIALAGLMSLNTAAVIKERALAGEDLRKRLHRHRVQTQFLGMASIFITSLWGMYQNLSLGVLR